MNYKPIWRCAAVVCAALLSLSSISTVFAQLANGDNDKWVGNITRTQSPDDNNNVVENFSIYWNQVTPENAAKWGNAESVQNTFNWENLERAYNFANGANYPFKQHTLIWGGDVTQGNAPTWIGALTADEQRAAITRWMNGYFQQFPNTQFVDVVNEPLDGHAPAYSETQGVGWMNFNGNLPEGTTPSPDNKWEWVRYAYQEAQAARAAANSNAQLLINDYGLLEDPSATDDYIELIRDVNSDGTLIEGVGIQAHFGPTNTEGSCRENVNDDNPLPINMDNVRDNLNKMAGLGLPVYIAEFDINYSGLAVDGGNDDDSAHADAFMSLFKMFYEHPQVEGITLWGFNQGKTWRPCTYLVNGNFEREALTRLRTYLVQQRSPWQYGKRIALRKTTGNFEYVSGENGERTLTSNRLERGNLESFTIVRPRRSRGFFLQCSSGRYVRPSQGSYACTGLRSASRFRLRTIDGQKVGIRCGRNGWLTAASDDGALQCVRTELGADQTFYSHVAFDEGANLSAAALHTVAVEQIDADFIADDSFFEEEVFVAGTELDLNNGKVLLPLFQR